MDLPYTTGLRFGETDPGPAPEAASLDFLKYALGQYYKALDLDEIESAGEWLEKAVLAERAMKWRYSDRICAFETAWFAATHRGEAEARWRLPAKLYGVGVDEFFVLRAEAAMLRAEGKIEDAAAAAAQAERLIDQCPATGWTALNRELLRSVPGTGLSALAEVIRADVAVVEPLPDPA